MNMNNKSQIQIGETIAVLFVFFILIIISLMFYTGVIKGNLELERDELSQLRSIGVAQRVMFLPEVQCSEDNIIADNCIDILKLDSAKSIMKENDVYYYDMLGFSDITISQIYPSELKWDIYSRKSEELENKLVTNVPVSLYNPGTKRHGFGILTIETWTK